MNGAMRLSGWAHCRKEMSPGVEQLVGFSLPPKACRTAVVVVRCAWIPYWGLTVKLYQVYMGVECSLLFRAWLVFRISKVLSIYQLMYPKTRRIFGLLCHLHKPALCIQRTALRAETLGRWGPLRCNLSRAEHKIMNVYYLRAGSPAIGRHGAP